MTSTSESPGPALPQMSPSTHVKMTADIATSYLGNNSIAPERVKDVILSIHDALREVHTTASVGAPSLKDEITSSVAALAAPAPQPAPVAEAPRASAPAPAVADAPAAQASAPAGRKAEAPKAEASKSRRGGRASAVTVPEPLADGGRVRRQPRLRTVGAEASAAPAPAPAPVEVAEAAAAKLPETPWAATHLGLQPTYAPRSAKEVEKIRKAVFVNDYEGKTGGFVRSLEDGQIRRMLKKHLKFLEIPPAEYLAKWGLPADFPLVHPDFSASRANQIKTAGLWEQRRSVRAKRGELPDAPAPDAVDQAPAIKSEKK